MDIRKRVVLADLKQNAIRSLLVKLLTEQSDKYDVELICESAYAKEFFQNSEAIDLLVVGEEFLGNVIHKAEIKSVLVLSDKPADLERLGFNSISRMENINKLFQTVLQRAEQCVPFPDIEIKTKTKTVVFFSLVGGIGKTTIALAMARKLAEKNKVLYIDAEGVNDFQLYLQTKTTLDADQISHIAAPGKLSYEYITGLICKNTFDYFPPLSMPLVTMGLKESIHIKLIDLMKEEGDYDILIIDTESHLDFNKMLLLQKADEVIVIIEETPISVHRTNNLLKYSDFYENKKKYIFIDNQYRMKKTNDVMSVEPVFPVDLVLPHINELSSGDWIKATDNPMMQRLSEIM